MNEKIRQIAIDAQIQMVSDARLQDFADRIIAECVNICEVVGEEAAGTAKSQYVTDVGRDIHIAMSMGAKSCALTIEKEFFKE